MVGVGGRGVIVSGKGDTVVESPGVIEGVFDGVSKITLDSKPFLSRVIMTNHPAAIITMIQSNNTIMGRTLRVDITF